MCHYRHYSHGEPLIYVGLQDITAHVDFTSDYCRRRQSGSGVEWFLYASTVSDELRYSGINVASVRARYGELCAAVYAAQKLLSPAEMGDLFKVIAFTKQLDAPLLGFSAGDKPIPYKLSSSIMRGMNEINQTEDTLMKARKTARQANAAYAVCVAPGPIDQGLGARFGNGFSKIRY